METSDKDFENKRLAHSAFKEELGKFREKLQGHLITENDDGYDEARKIWNGIIDKKPLAVVKCYADTDVVHAVNFARDNGLRLSVRGGGHNVAGKALCDGGIVIDLSPMKQVHVDPGRMIVRVSGGATLGDIDKETQKFGLVTPLGVVSKTGVAGLTLHGGIGFLTRKYGLASDNLIAAEVVTSDGRKRVADENQNTDLLWALKGGGGSFGVVTSFEFSLHRLNSEIYFVMVMYSMNQSVKILQAWRELVKNAPDETMSLALLWSFPDEEFIPEEHRHQPCLVIIAAHSGSLGEGETALRPFRNMDTPVADLSGPMAFQDVQKTFDADYPDGRHYYWKSTYVNDLSDELIHNLVNYAYKRPSHLSSLDLWSLGGAMGRIEKSASAFAQRDASFLVALESNWENHVEDDMNISWTKKVHADLQRFSNGGTYLNFAGFGENNSDLVRKTFGENFKKLKTIKEMYDPENLFSSTFNIK